jgi:hypothetical protein
MPKPYKFRELVQTLSKYDRRFEFWVNRGKGSEQIIFHPDINGRPESFPLKCHGQNTELRKGVISGIVRRFNLPRDLL